MSVMGAGVNRVATVAMVSGVLLGTSALGYGVARATSGHASLASDTAVTTGSSTHPRAPIVPAPSTAPSTAPARVREQVSAPLPAARPRATPEAGPRILGPGDHGARVRALQARLRQLAWYAGNVADDYGRSTTTAVKGFQGKRRIAVTGYVDQRTLNRLEQMTSTP